MACGETTAYFAPGDGYFGATQVERYPDYTQYSDTGGYNQCNPNGTYRTGSGPGSENATRAALQREVDKRKAIRDSLVAEENKCKSRPTSGFGNDPANPCSFESRNYRVSEIGHAESNLRDAESELDNFNACIKDRDRRMQAQQPRPQIDPAAVLGIMQGLGRRPQSYGHNVQSGGHGNGNQKH
jgi:hypothetical protein